MNDAIRGFKKEFRFLSSFYPCAVLFDGIMYKTVEHAYQAAKTADLEQRKFIATFKTPGLAKQFGKTLCLSADWDQKKVEVMQSLQKQKFQNPFLAPLLAATEDLQLVEENTWHDNFWGVCVCNKCPGTGINMLGKILEDIRNELKRNGSIVVDYGV